MLYLTYLFCYFQPPPGAWDHTVDDREHTVEQWKELIYQEVTEYERTHNISGPGGTAARSGAAVGTTAGSNPSKVENDDDVMQHAAAAATGGRR